MSTRPRPRGPGRSMRPLRTRRSRRARRAQRLRPRRAFRLPLLSLARRSSAGSTAAWGACSSPKAYTGLASGSHSFDVRAIDAAGNVDATPPPGPGRGCVRAGHRRSRRARRARRRRLRRACRSPLLSPARRLSAGSTVRLGELAARRRPTPASQTASTPSRSARSTPPATSTRPRPRGPGAVDASAPDTSISAGPSGTTSSTSASVSFASSESGSSFECRLDGSAGGPVARRRPTRAGKRRPYLLEVRAIDAAPPMSTPPRPREPGPSAPRRVERWCGRTTLSARRSLATSGGLSVKRTTDHMAQTKHDGSSRRRPVRAVRTARRHRWRVGRTATVGRHDEPDGTSFRPKEGWTSITWPRATTSGGAVPWPGGGSRLAGVLGAGLFDAGATVR